MPEGLALQKGWTSSLEFSSSVLTKKQDRPLPFLPSSPRRRTFCFPLFFFRGVFCLFGFLFLAVTETRELIAAKSVTTKSCNCSLSSTRYERVCDPRGLNTELETLG